MLGIFSIVEKQTKKGQKHHRRLKGCQTKLKSGLQNMLVNMDSQNQGVIIDNDKTTLFNELVKNVILTSRKDVREMEDDDDNNEPTLVTDF